MELPQFSDRAVSTIAGHQITGANLKICAGDLIVHSRGDPIIVRVQRGELVAATHRDVEFSQPLNQ